MTSNGQNLILNAVNKVRGTAQSLVNFERLRRDVRMTVNIATGTNLSTAVLADATVVTVNNIKSVSLRFTDGSFLPIDYVSYNSFLQRRKRILQGQYPTLRMRESVAELNSRPSVPFAYRQDRTLYVWPDSSPFYNNATSVDVMLDAYIKDTDWGSFNQVELEYTGDPAEAGPFVGDGGGTSATFQKRGEINGNSFFAGGSGSVFYVADDPPYWFMSDRVTGGFPTYGWRSPSGVNGIMSQTGWTAVGFTPTPSATFGTINSVVAYDPGDVDEFWRDEAQEWLSLRVIQFLQTHYIKDQTRWPVTQKMVDHAWGSVCAWNTSIGDGEPDSDLD